MENQKLKLILASASPRRKELLGHLKLPYEIIIKNIPEESNHTDPVKFSAQIAAQKNEAVFKEQIDNCLVVSADTIVCLGSKIYGKPSGVEEARQFLSELSGKSHSVFTAVTLGLKVNGVSKVHSFVEETKVTFSSISHELMERYLATGDSLDKAGAYGIQNGSLTFISKVEGDYSNVVGFPLARFVTELDSFLKPYTSGKSWFDLF